MKLLAFLFSFIAFFNTSEQNTHQPLKSSIELDMGGNKSFAIFLSHFEKTDASLMIDHIAIQNYKTYFLSKSNLKNAMELKMYIPELGQAKFSRIGPPIVQPLNRFYPNDEMIAVTYLSKYRYDNIGFSVMLALYDLKGNHITSTSLENGRNELSVAIAGVGLDQTILCSFEYPNVINKTTYKNVWENDIGEFGINDNVITSYEKLKSESLTIQSGGEIEVIDNTSSYASLK